MLFLNEIAEALQKDETARQLRQKESIDSSAAGNSVAGSRLQQPDDTQAEGSAPTEVYKLPYSVLSGSHVPCYELSEPPAEKGKLGSSYGSNLRPVCQSSKDPSTSPRD